MNDLASLDARSLAPSFPAKKRAAAWIDHHGHMNVGYYGVAIDAGLHGFTIAGDGRGLSRDHELWVFRAGKPPDFQKRDAGRRGLPDHPLLIDWNAKLMHTAAGMYRPVTASGGDGGTLGPCRPRPRRVAALRRPVGGDRRTGQQ